MSILSTILTPMRSFLSSLGVQEKIFKKSK